MDLGAASAHHERMKLEAVEDAAAVLAHAQNEYERARDFRNRAVRAAVLAGVAPGLVAKAAGLSPGRVTHLTSAPPAGPGTPGASARRGSRSARLGPHAATADALIRSWLPDAAQRRTLLDWVDARPWRSDPRLHTVNCNRGLWSQWAAGTWPASLGTERSTLSRGELFELAQESRSEGVWLPLLAATFAWGYGPSGLGYDRFLKVSQRGGVEEALKRAVEVLDDAGSVAAYERLRGEVWGLGPAFFTKFLYFAQGARPGQPPPLILDARVAAACRTLAKSCLMDAGTDPELADELVWWQWSDTGWTAHRYGVYLDVATRLTEHLEQTGDGRWPTGRADVVELALFDQELLDVGVWA